MGEIVVKNQTTLTDTAALIHVALYLADTESVSDCDGEICDFDYGDREIDDSADSAKPLLFGINPNGESNGLAISYGEKIYIIGQLMITEKLRLSVTDLTIRSCWRRKY